MKELRYTYPYIYEKLSQYERYIGRSEYGDTTKLKTIVDKMRKETSFNSFTQEELAIICRTVKSQFVWDIDRKALEEFTKVKKEYNLNG